MRFRIIQLILFIFILSFSCTRLADSSHKETSTVLENVLERGVLRVVTDFNSTSYFIYRGQPMGYQYEMLQELADRLGVRLDVKVNNNLEEKFDMLSKGEVDLIAVNLAVTKDRREKMSFTVPYAQTRQVLIQRKPAKWQWMNATALEDSLIRNQLELSHKIIHVQKNSSYAQRLKNLSNEIGDTIYIIESEQTDEELMAMVARGEINYTVCDEIIAKVGGLYYNNIDIKTPISFYQNVAWALSKNAPDLKQTIDIWLNEFKESRKYALITHKYFENKRAAEIVASDYYSIVSGKISPYDALIKEFSEEIGWDWRLVASIIYQESRFNPHARSWAGAYGLMQLMPSTGERFGVTPSSPLKSQIRAGLMYIQWLDKRFSDIKDSEERKKFILASYNIGHGHILDARALAAKNHKNPDKWDNSVAEFLLLKSDPHFYTDPVVKYGYCRGTETYQYVTDVMERYGHYKNLVLK